MGFFGFLDFIAEKDVSPETIRRPLTVSKALRVFISCGGLMWHERQDAFLSVLMGVRR